MPLLVHWICLTYPATRVKIVLIKARLCYTMYEEKRRVFESVNARCVYGYIWVKKALKS